MKKILIFIFSVIICHSCFAQVDTVDLCKKIEEFTDKFDNTRHFNTVTGFETNKSYGIRYTPYGVEFIKYISKGKETYYLSLTTTTTLPDVTEYGVIILLKNGVKIKKPSAKVKTSVNSSGEYEVNSFITLNALDISALKKSPITDFKLYVDQSTVERPEDVYKMFLCLLNKK